MKNLTMLLITIATALCLSACEDDDYSGDATPVDLSGVQTGGTG